MTKRHGLGKGLSSMGVGELLSHVNRPATPHTNASNLLNVDLLQRGQYQPRKDMNYEALEELSQSIKSQGIIQPIIVRPLTNQPENKQYEIIAGERRWQAAKLAGLPQVPVIIRDLTDEAAMAMALIENIQREDLNAIEEATALARLLNEFDLTHQEIADHVGKSRTTVTNLLRLLTLNDSVKKLVEHGDLSAGHAKVLLALPDDKQQVIAKQVVSQNLSVRDTEKLIKRLNQSKPLTEPTSSQEHDTEATSLKALETSLQQTLNTKVQIKTGRDGGGQIVLHYENEETMRKLYAQLT